MILKVIRKGAICELRLDAPPANILDRETCEHLAGAIREQGRDKTLKAFLLTAKGDHFSYGASVPEHTPGEVEKFLPAFHDVFYAFAESCVPVVAAVRGLCLGGACELVAFAHLVVAEECAKFGVPEITLGVLPPAACVLLPWRLGGAAADEMILTGRSIPARECGLVNLTCPDGGLDEAVAGLLEKRILPRSAAALRFAVKANRGPLHREIGERLPALERLYLDELMATRDAHEGIAAFLEKRRPVWVDA